MKRLPVFMIAAIFFGPASTQKINTNAEKLDGVWVTIRQEQDGKDLPEEVYEKYRLTITDSAYAYTNDDKGAVRYNNGKMDLYGREGANAGRHFTAIYKLEGDQLTICYNMAGDRYPGSFETRNDPSLLLTEYKRKE